MKKEVRERIVLPLLIPLGAMAVIAIVAIGFALVLLNVPKSVATAVAAMVAINILVVFGVVAVRERLTQSQMFMMMVASVIPLVIGGAVAVGAVEVSDSEGHEHEEPGGPPTVQLVAENIAFDPNQLEVGAGRDFIIEFENRDPDPHNVAIFKGPDATAENVFRGEVFPGVRTVSYTVPAQEPGSYYFHCDVHPQMTGTLTVTEAAAPAEDGEGEAAEPASASISADDLAFDPTELTLPANTPISLVFDNQENLPHNVAIFSGEDASGEVLFRGEVITGPRKVTYRVPSLEPGRYHFHCDVHPNMTGTITVS